MQSGLDGELAFDEPIAKHTSYRIGGPADILATPSGVDGLVQLLEWARDVCVPVFVLGAGSNLLVSDRGIRGLVIDMSAGFRQVSVQGCEISAGAAVRLPVLVRHSLGAALAGLECLSGIPGSVGGAVRMNAGTSSGCIADSLVEVTAADRDGMVRTLPASALGLRYRDSNVGDLGLIVVEAKFSLVSKPGQDLRVIVESMLARRKSTQPAGAKTAGSVFRNPCGDFAGRLLESVGAKGMQVGGARVSMKHANFIENTGNASADDVWTLVCRLRKIVQESTGIVLEPEIQRVGEWDQDGQD